MTAEACRMEASGERGLCGKGEGTALLLTHQSLSFQGWRQERGPNVSLTLEKGWARGLLRCSPLS